MPSREVLLELRKIRPGVKVIVTTAYGRDHALAAVDAEKSCPYTRKPYQISELTDLILKTCQDKATFAATE